MLIYLLLIPFLYLYIGGLTEILVYLIDKGKNPIKSTDVLKGMLLWPLFYIIVLPWELTTFILNKLGANIKEE